MNKKERKVIGWREWVELPGLKIKEVKAKVDTGARSSSLHAYDITTHNRRGEEFVKFVVHPEQGSSKTSINCRAKVLEYRKIKSSNGQTELRPVIVTNVRLMGLEWPIEITLTNRDEMGFRMLLGRESIRKKFYVDSGSSFIGKKSLKRGK